MLLYYTQIDYSLASTATDNFVQHHSQKLFGRKTTFCLRLLMALYLRIDSGGKVLVSKYRVSLE